MRGYIHKGRVNTTKILINRFNTNQIKIPVVPMYKLQADYNIYMEDKGPRIIKQI